MNKKYKVVAKYKGKYRDTLFVYATIDKFGDPVTADNAYVFPVDFYGDEKVNVGSEICLRFIKAEKGNFCGFLYDNK